MLLEQKQLLHRELNIHMRWGGAITIEREYPLDGGKYTVRSYNLEEITRSSMVRVTNYINQPGRKPEINLIARTLEFYDLKWVTKPQPKEPEPQEPDEQSETVEINGETYSIPL